MNEIVDFIKENYVSIAIIVIVVLFLLVIIKIKEIDLNPPKQESKLVQQVIVETLDNMSMEDSQENIERLKLNPAESFCESYLGNSLELEGACNELTEGNCATTKCCVYTGKKCVAGDKDGPTYKTDKDGKLITIDSYYYLGKCHGTNCPT